MCATNTSGQFLDKKPWQRITSKDLDLWMTAQLEAGLQASDREQTFQHVEPNS